MEEVGCAIVTLKAKMAVVESDRCAFLYRFEGFLINSKGFLINSSEMNRPQVSDYSKYIASKKMQISFVALFSNILFL